MKFVEKFAVDGAHSSFYSASIPRSTLPRAALLRLIRAGHNSKVRFVFFDIATLKAYLQVAERLGNPDSASSYKIEKGPS